MLFSFLQKRWKRSIKLFDIISLIDIVDLFYSALNSFCEFIYLQ